ncbi:MAG: hypothetical protein WAV11_00450 [Minisyncoccia bacterium]
MENTKIDKTKFEEIIKKIEDLKKTGEVDITSEEDLSLAVMNLIGVEEHLYFTAEKTKKPVYFEMLHEAREERKKLMKKLLPKNEGESWCLSKHLLSTTMRMMEVGTKLFTDGKKDEAKEMFDGAYKIYSMFWALRFGIMKAHEIQACAIPGTETDENKPMTMEDIVSKLVDCCKE